MRSSVRARLVTVWTVLASLLVTPLLALIGSTPAHAAPANCPSGYVCVYPGTDTNAYPSLKYYNYGTYDFTNQWGNKVVYNNQTGGAAATVYTGTNGTGTATTIPAGTYRTMDFGPLNSIKLSAATKPLNCPSGYVCVYPGTDPNAVPSLKYYNYGVYNFTNQYGNKIIFNNQTGGASAAVYTGSNGTGTATTLAAGTFRTMDFGPLNSIRLGSSSTYVPPTTGGSVDNPYGPSWGANGGWTPRAAWLRDQIKARFGSTCTTYATSSGEHATGNGLDCWGSLETRRAIASWAAANAAPLEVYYVIHEQKIWGIYAPYWSWMEDRGSITQNHYDHVHISMQTPTHEY